MGKKLRRSLARNLLSQGWDKMIIDCQVVVAQLDRPCNYQAFEYPKRTENSVCREASCDARPPNEFPHEKYYLFA